MFDVSTFHNSSRRNTFSRQERDRLVRLAALGAVRTHYAVRNGALVTTTEGPVTFSVEVNRKTYAGEICSVSSRASRVRVKCEIGRGGSGQKKRVWIHTNRSEIFSRSVIQYASQLTTA